MERDHSSRDPFDTKKFSNLSPEILVEWIAPIHQVLLYVNSTEKWTGMKNTGLKIPEKDQIYV